SGQRMQVEPPSDGGQLAKVNVDAKVDIQSGDRLACGILDRRESGDPRAGRTLVNPGIGWDTLRQQPTQNRLDIGRQLVLETYRRQAVADDRESGRRALDVGERVDSVAQLIRLLDAHELAAEPRVLGRIAPRGSDDGLMQITVHQEGARTGNVEQ